MEAKLTALSRGERTCATGDVAYSTPTGIKAVPTCLSGVFQVIRFTVPNRRSLSGTARSAWPRSAYLGEGSRSVITVLEQPEDPAPPTTPGMPGHVLTSGYTRRPTATEGSGSDEHTALVQRGSVRPLYRRVLPPRTCDGAVGAPGQPVIRRRHPLGGVVRSDPALQCSPDPPGVVRVPLERARPPQAQSKVVPGGTEEVDRVRSRSWGGVPWRSGDRR